MIIKIDKSRVQVRPTAVILRMVNQNIAIPKSFILNKDTFMAHDQLELEDWFYNIYIGPMVQSETESSQNHTETAADVIANGENIQGGV